MWYMFKNATGIGGKNKNNADCFFVDKVIKMSLIKIKQHLNDFAEKFIQGMKDKSTTNAYQLL